MYAMNFNTTRPEFLESLDEQDGKFTVEDKKKSLF